MDGNVVASQLSAPPEPARVGVAAFSWATPDDDAEIRALLCETPMAGAVRVGFGREPSYFAGQNLAGAEDRTLLARAGGRLVCLGSLSEREVWADGRALRVGYLGGLRLAEGTARSMVVLREGYRRFVDHARRSPAEAWFTSIAGDNVRALQVLAGGRAGLPRYTPLADLETRVMPIGRRGPVAADGSAKVTAGDEAELTAFLNRQGERYQLGITWTATRWAALARHGFTLADVRVVRRGGRIVAVAGVWDQSPWRQVVVHGYAGALRLLRPVANAWAVCAGRACLPAAGERLRQASVFPFAVEPEHAGALDELWRSLEAGARVRGVEWLTLALDARDPLGRGWRTSARTRIYRTRLYSVSGDDFGGDVLAQSERWFRPEVALL